MSDLAFFGFDDDDGCAACVDGQPCDAAGAHAPPTQGLPVTPVLNLLKGSITGDPSRRPLRIRADFVTCTQ